MAHKRRPPKPQDDTPHIQALQKHIRKTELHTHTGVAWLIDGFPELADLHYTITELLELADARSGAKWDESRGSPNPLSADGKSTAAGRSTYGARHRLLYWRKRVAGLCEAMKSDLDPNTRRTADPSPRCGRRACDGRGRRQPVGVKFCGFCREELKA